MYIVVFIVNKNNISMTGLVSNVMIITGFTILFNKIIGCVFKKLKQYIELSKMDAV